MRFVSVFSFIFAMTPVFADETIQFQNQPRTFIVHIPPGASPKGLPLVFVLHGGGGTAEGMESISGFDAVADANHFVAVYPQGLNKHWNDRREGQETQADDVGFIRTLIDHFAQKYSVDVKRVYSTGLSNGGLFSYRLACELSDRITAIAPVAANLGFELAQTCAPRRAVSVLNIEGDSDPLMPFEGGFITGPFGLKKRGKVLSSDQTLKFWIAKNGCTADSTSRILTAPAGSPTQVEVETFPSCREKSSVMRYKVVNGGHTWPGGVQYMGERLVGKTSRLFNATEVIWKFFSQH